MPDRPERCPNCGSYSLHLSYRNGVARCDECSDQPLIERTVVRDIRELDRTPLRDQRTRRFS